jgi:hypothetical protein
MKQRGVLYDVGRALGPRGGTWRPDYSPALARRELEIIRTGLHANAVRICGRDPGRVLAAARDALEQGLEVWLCPEYWNATPARTLRYLTAAAAAAEPLRERWPDRLVFSVGNELTLFMRGIVPGRSYRKRSDLPVLREVVRSGRHTPPLRAFLADAVAAVRRVYHGPVGYCALPIEDVDWDLFDVIGVNYYRRAQNSARYPLLLERLLATGKPVTVTELGFPACRDADDVGLLASNNDAGLGSYALLGLLGLPGVRRLIRPPVARVHPRDEATQARLLLDHLNLLEQIGVDGAFIVSFSFPIAVYDPDPRRDHDATALSLVRTLPRGQRGTTYPDMSWEPKQAFRAVAGFYASRPAAP